MSKSEYSSTGKVRSFFGKYKINDVDVEVIGNFQVKLENGEWSKINRLEDLSVYNYQNTQIPVLTLEQELQRYENMNIPNRVLNIKKRLIELK